MDRDVAQLLLGSIQQDKLVFLCGAGLSIAPPSCVPSAAQLAQLCAEEYDRCGLPKLLSPTARQNLGELAEFFLANNQMDLFIDRLVKWDLFCGDVNSGHTAIADFATCKACVCVITTNFDVLAENAAAPLGEKALRGALDGDEANVDRGYRPLLKIHGCLSQRDYTLWCDRQLDPLRTDSISLRIRARLESSRTWMRANLPNRHLVLVGFWSDWKYLNGVLLDSVRGIHPTEICLVDPAPDTELQAKAPELWAWASGFPHFQHVQEKAEVFLRELQEVFSRNILERVLKDAADAAPGVCGDFSVVSNALGGLDTNALYALRRDFAGAPSGRVAKWKEPQQGMHAVGKAHLSMISSGARLEGSSYVTASGKRVRVVNGWALPMSKVEADYSREPPKVTPDDYVICAPVDSDAGHRSIIPSATPSIVRPGSTAEWLTAEEARDKGIL